MKVYILNHYAREGMRYRLFDTKYFSTMDKREKYWQKVKERFANDIFEYDTIELDPVIKMKEDN